jgi:hypothetical protein
VSLLDLIGVNRIFRNGSPINPTRKVLNFLGSGVSIVDNPGADRTDITISGGGGGGGASDSDEVANVSTVTPAPTVSDALELLATQITARATTVALNALTAIVNGKAAQTAIDALKAPTYLVQTSTAALDNERAVSGIEGITVDYGTAGQAIVKPNPALLRVPLPTWTDVPAFTPGANYTVQPSLPRAITAADVGRALLTVNLELYVLLAYQMRFDIEANGQAAHTEYNNVWARVVFDWEINGFQQGIDSNSGGIMNLIDRIDALEGAPAPPTVTTAAPVAIGASGAPLSAGTGTALALATHVHTLAAADRTALDTTLPNLATTVGNKANKAWTDNPQAGAYTLVAADVDRFTRMNSASANVLTVPPDAAAIPLMQPMAIVRPGAGITTITAGGGVTLRPSNNLRLLNQWDFATITKIGANEYLVKGDVVI